VRPLLDVLNEVTQYHIYEGLEPRSSPSSLITADLKAQCQQVGDLFASFHVEDEQLEATRLEILQLLSLIRGLEAQDDTGELMLALRRALQPLVCDGCSYVLVGGKIVAFQGRSYHWNCFRCRKCRAQITAAQFVVEHHEPVCAACCPQCATCKQPILDQMVTIGDLSHHHTCLRCHRCQGGFRTHVYLSDLQPVCGMCVDPVFPNRWSRGSVSQPDERSQPVSIAVAADGYLQPTVQEQTELDRCLKYELAIHDTMDPVYESVLDESLLDSGNDDDYEFIDLPNRSLVLEQDTTSFALAPSDDGLRLLRNNPPTIADATSAPKPAVPFVRASDYDIQRLLHSYTPFLLEYCASSPKALGPVLLWLDLEQFIQLLAELPLAELKPCSHALLRKYLAPGAELHVELAPKLQHDVVLVLDQCLDNTFGDTLLDAVSLDKLRHCQRCIARFLEERVLDMFLASSSGHAYLRQRRLDDPVVHVSQASDQVAVPQRVAVVGYVRASGPSSPSLSTTRPSLSGHASSARRLASTLKRTTIMYIVSLGTATNSYRLRRRYRDFRMVYDAILRNVPDVELAAFPPKTFLASSSRETSQHRQSALDAWIKSLLRQPAVWSLEETRQFFAPD